MNFLIYGAGALGQTLGCMLAAQNHQVDLILRSRFIDSIHDNGLHVSGFFGNFHATNKQLSLYQSIEQTTISYDYVLITTKAYDTAKAANVINTIGKRANHVVSMQNGCGNIEILEKHFGPEKTLGSRVITGFEITSPGNITITVSADAIHVGGCKRGIIPDSATTLAALLSEAGHPSLAVEDIHQSLFAKLLYNCALNPLGAILGVNYGRLTEHDDTTRIIDLVIDETFKVIAALGGKTPWPDSNTYKKTFYDTLIPATYNHRPSMLQDLENNKPTEVDALVGFVSSQGKQVAVATPTCDLLAAMVKFKESQNIT